MTFEKKSGKPKAVGGAKETSAPKITRRRFTKAGVVAPVVMTLGSRPVWGACSLSGALSGNASNQHNEPAGTVGYPPEYWRNQLGSLVSAFGVEPLTDTELGNAYCIPASGTVKVYDLADFPIVSNFFGCQDLSDQDVYHALLGDGLEAQGVAAYLNALTYEGEYGAHPEDIKAFMCSGLMDISETLQCMNNQTEYTPSQPTECHRNLACYLGPNNDREELEIVVQSSLGGECIVFVTRQPVVTGTTK